MKTQMKVQEHSITKTLVNLFIMTMLAVAISLDAVAAEGAIRLTNKAMKQVITTNDKGEREVTFVEPKTVIPGDVILYTIEFENVSNDSASNIVIDDPMPNNSYYRDGSATGKNSDIRFSVDGKNFDVAEDLFVTEAGNRRLADAKDYRSIRWIYTVPLKPGEKQSVSFKTQIKKANE